MLRFFFVLAFGFFLANSFGAPLSANQKLFIKLNKLVNKLARINFRAKINDLEHKFQYLKNRMNGARVHCINKVSSWQPRSDGSIMFLDRQYVGCPYPYSLVSFILGRQGDYNSARVRYYYRCCKFTL